MKLRRLAFAVVCAAALMPALAHGASSCSGFVAPVVDGRINVPITIDIVADKSVEFYLQPGHSYSAEVLLPSFNNDMTVIFGGPNTACPAADSAGFTHTESTSPNFLTAGSYRRASITIPSGNNANDFYTIRVGASNPETVTVSISDTTMYNPRWSTFSGFITQWGFQNTTNAAISGTLTVVDGVSGGPYTKSVSVPAGGKTVFVTTSDTFGGGPIPGSHAGGAIFTHNGPPGSIKADAYFINGSGSVIVPSEFKAVREAAH